MKRKAFDDEVRERTEQKLRAEHNRKIVASLQPQWTKEPPTEPGWYWWRQLDTSLPGPFAPRPALLEHGPDKEPLYFCLPFGMSPDTGEWWPVPLEPPR